MTGICGPRRPNNQTMAGIIRAQTIWNERTMGSRKVKKSTHVLLRGSCALPAPQPLCVRGIHPSSSVPGLCTRLRAEGIVSDCDHPERQTESLTESSPRRITHGLAGQWAAVEANIDAALAEAPNQARRDPAGNQIRSGGASGRGKLMSTRRREDLPGLLPSTKCTAPQMTIARTSSRLVSGAAGDTACWNWRRALLDMPQSCRGLALQRYMVAAALASAGQHRTISAQASGAVTGGRGPKSAPLLTVKSSPYAKCFPNMYGHTFKHYTDLLESKLGSKDRTRVVKEEHMQRAKSSPRGSASSSASSEDSRLDSNVQSQGEPELDIEGANNLETKRRRRERSNSRTLNAVEQLEGLAYLASSSSRRQKKEAAKPRGFGSSGDCRSTFASTLVISRSSSRASSLIRLRSPFFCQLSAISSPGCSPRSLLALLCLSSPKNSRIMSTDNLSWEDLRLTASCVAATATESLEAFDHYRRLLSFRMVEKYSDGFSSELPHAQ
ncbi:hypothetical protein FB451DRAFT_1434180 [Mycena latifolia]|nr:hypothetical protein FB451DRAFT_1434180 [Mycena latifolia]